MKRRNFNIVGWENWINKKEHATSRAANLFLFCICNLSERVSYSYFVGHFGSPNVGLCSIHSAIYSTIYYQHIWKWFWAKMRQKADNTIGNATNSPTCPIIIVYAHRKVSFCVSFRHFTGTIIIIIHTKAKARQRRTDVVTMVNYVLNTKHSQRLLNCCCCQFCFYIFWRVYVFYADSWLFANKNKDRTPF